MINVLAPGLDTLWRKLQDRSLWIVTIANRDYLMARSPFAPNLTRALGVPFEYVLAAAAMLSLALNIFLGKVIFPHVAWIVYPFIQALISGTGFVLLQFRFMPCRDQFVARYGKNAYRNAFIQSGFWVLVAILQGATAPFLMNFFGPGGASILSLADWLSPRIFLFLLALPGFFFITIFGMFAYHSRKSFSWDRSARYFYFYEKEEDHPHFSKLSYMMRHPHYATVMLFCISWGFFARNLGVLMQSCVYVTIIYFWMRHEDIEFCKRNPSKSQMVARMPALFVSVDDLSRYFMTPYIAEFWNCLSNIWYLAFGIPALISCKRNNLEFRFYLLSLWMILIGFGSGAYHMTMLPSWSALDTAPMMGFQFSLSYIFTVMGIRPGDHTALRTSVAVGYSLLSLLMFMLGWAFPAAFNILFLCIISISIPLSIFWCLYPRTRKSELGKRMALWALAAGLFAIASVFWINDKKWCYPLRDIRQAWIRWSPSLGDVFAGVLEFHGWWHLFTAATLHTMTALGEYIRCTQIGRSLRFRDLFFCLKAASSQKSGETIRTAPGPAELNAVVIDSAPIKHEMMDTDLPPPPLCIGSKGSPPGDAQIPDPVPPDESEGSFAPWRYSKGGPSAKPQVYGYRSRPRPDRRGASSQALPYVT
ncbi:putative Ceramidase [Paratrimastix pyriformis]|uniref:Ceramidase n=1 Tax=Paratrimastix pyriformis TaxID=342808 RepID=A0ABQ8UBD0_9EUKA|nr:putative Ceramidase [Paratrimastix pyriformis]